MEITASEINSLLETLNPLLFWNLLVIVVCGVLGLLFGRMYKKTGSRQLLNGLPGICTSMGIFCTFCSICISLQRLDESSMDLPKIINNLIPAFSTSIYGIIFALVATIYSKLDYAQKDHRAENEQNTPEENLYTIAKTTETLVNNLQDIPSIIRDIKTVVSALGATVSNQESEMRQLRVDLCKNLTTQTTSLKEFIDTFVARMDDIFDSMSNSIERNIQSFGEDQFQRSSEIIEGITSKLKDITQTILESQSVAVQEMVGDTRESLQKVSSTVENMVSQMSESNTAALESLKNAQTEELETLLTAQRTQLDAMTENHVRWAEQANAAWQTQYDAITNSNTESLQQMIDLKAAYEELCAKMLEETRKANGDTVSALQSSVAQFTNDIHASVETQCNELAQAISGNVSMLKNSYSYIDSHLAQIKSDYEQATLAFRDAVQNAHDINESFEHTIESVDTSLKAVDVTNQNIQTILQIIESKQTNTNALVQKIKEMSEVLETLQQLESVLNKIARK